MKYFTQSELQASEPFLNVAALRKASHQRRFSTLCQLYLFKEGRSPTWRISRTSTQESAEQGWKIHVSATILSACDIFEAVASICHSEQVPYKVAKSLRKLSAINCGLKVGYSQIGKFITIYAISRDQALRLLAKLTEATRNLPGPTIPFDYQYDRSAPVYFRYGTFTSRSKITFRGKEYDALKDQAGRYFPDRGRDKKFLPSFVEPLINLDDFSEKPGFWLQHNLYPLDSFVKRGKGTVLRALNLGLDKPALCVLKVGRRHGETEWDGRDGIWRLENEVFFNSLFHKNQIPVPKILDIFRQPEQIWVVYEYLGGRILSDVIRDKRVGFKRRVEICEQLAQLVNKVHELGYVLRDIKPANVYCNKLQSRPELVLIDLEGACKIDARETAWGTSRYLPPRGSTIRFKTLREQDLYSLACTCADVLVGVTRKRPRLEILKNIHTLPLALLNLTNELS